MHCVDVIPSVGLGPLGKLCLTPAEFSCHVHASQLCQQQHGFGQWSPGKRMLQWSIVLGMSHVAFHPTGRPWPSWGNAHFPQTCSSHLGHPGQLWRGDPVGSACGCILWGHSSFSSVSVLIPQQNLGLVCICLPCYVCGICIWRVSLLLLGFSVVPTGNFP